MTEYENNKKGGFYMLPRQLFTEDCPLSLEARVLYCLILDRTKLSLANGWHDKYNKTYIYYTVSEAAKMLCCGESKASHIFAELERTAFITRRQQGQGKPCMIYLNRSMVPSLDKQRITYAHDLDDDDLDMPF